MSAEDPPNNAGQGAGAKRLGHERALDTDLRDHFNRGENVTVFIEVPPEQNGGDEAIAKINRDQVKDATVFIEPGRRRLHRADKVHCRIRDVEDDYIKAIAKYRLD